MKLRHATLPGLFVLSLLAFLAAPGQPVAASECGGDVGVICSETKTCKFFWWWCSTSYGLYAE